MAVLGTANTLVALDVPENLPAEKLANELLEKAWKPSFSVLVLDMSLGNRSDDGLQMMKYIHHCYDGAVVIHSSQWQDERIQSEARRLGIRFGCSKNAENLPELVKAAERVSFMRSATLGDALHHERSPIPEYDIPEGVPDLDELWTRLKRLGRRFDGTDASVNWEEVQLVQEIVDKHYHLAESQGYSRFYRDNPHEKRQGAWYEFFEDYVINTIPVGLKLEKSFKRAINEAEPFICF
jgi:hypothetical protein